MKSVLPEAETEFGAKVRTRLEQENVVWFSTVNSRGIPQPNPVWFIWDGKTLLTYNLTSSARVRNVSMRPQVSLHFNQIDGSQDIVVLTGNAVVDQNAPSPEANQAYLAKYGSLMPLLGHDPATFAATYSVPIAVHLEKIRGM